MSVYRGEVRVVLGDGMFWMWVASRAWRTSRGREDAVPAGLGCRSVTLTWEEGGSWAETAPGCGGWGAAGALGCLSLHPPGPHWAAVESSGQRKPLQGQTPRRHPNTCWGQA